MKLQIPRPTLRSVLTFAVIAMAVITSTGLIGPLAPAAAQTVPPAKRAYITLTAATPVVAPGATVDLSVRLFPAITGLSDTVTWSTDGGTVTPLTPPLFPFYAGTAELEAPSEPGIYTVRVRSSFYPHQFAEATVVVRGAPRLLLESDDWVLLDGIGATHTIDMRRLAADGTLSTPTGLTWTSSDSETVTGGCRRPGDRDHVAWRRDHRSYRRHPRSRDRQCLDWQPRS